MHITAALFAGIKPAAGSERASPSQPIDNAAVVREMKADPRNLQWQNQTSRMPNG